MPSNPSYADRQREVGEELVRMLGDRLPPLGDASVKVSRPSVPDSELKSMPDTARIWVVETTNDSAVRRVARGRVLADYGFGVVSAVRYVPPAERTDDGPVPREWLDDRLGWIDENVYGFLNDRVKKQDRLLGSLWPQTCRYKDGLRYSAPDLDQDKLLWSVIEVTYREGRKG